MSQQISLNSNGRYKCKLVYLALKCDVHLFISSDQDGCVELFPNDWILFDELNRFSCYSDSIFQSEFIQVENEGSESKLLYQRKKPVIAEQIRHSFHAYADTLCFRGEENDFLVQDNFSPYFQSIFHPEIFEKYFIEELDNNSTELSPRIDNENDNEWDDKFFDRSNSDFDETPRSSSGIKKRRSSALQRSSQNRVILVKNNTISFEENILVAEVFRRRTETFSISFPVQNKLTIWKCESGQGGRCQGRTNDLAVFHSTGDFDGFYTPSELLQYYRFHYSPFSTQELSNSYHHSVCTLVSVCDVLAVELKEPKTAVNSARCVQYGSPGDFLVQAIFPPPLPTVTVPAAATNAASTSPTLTPPSTPSSPSFSAKLSQWIVSSHQFDKQFIATNPLSSHSDRNIRHRNSNQESHRSTYLTGDSYNPTSLRRITSAPIRIESGINHENHNNQPHNHNSFSEPETSANVIHIHPPEDMTLNIFDQYNHNLKCWSGILQRRSRYLRQWNKKYYELYPERLVVYKELPPSTGTGAVPSSSLSSSLTSLTLNPFQNYSSGDHSFIDLRYCVVHSVIVDDKSVLYLGNAKSSEEGDIKPLPLEPYAVTSTSERWESRYQKLTRLYQSSSSFSSSQVTKTTQIVLAPEVVAERGSFGTTTSVVKSIQNFSYSNANGIFLMAPDIETHNLLMILLKECILFCRRSMAFHAAVTGDTNKLLEVLCSVSPDEANRILLSPKDEHSSKLIIHEAASTSPELLKLLLSLGEDTFEHSHTTHDGGGNISMIRSSVIEGGVPSYLFLSPKMTCAKGLNCLHYAVLVDNMETVKYLLENEIFQMDINCQTLHGHTPLHYAKSSNMTTYLLGKGANPTALDDEGRTPLMMMASFGNTAALTRLFRDVPLETIDINRQSWKTGYTALVFACLLLGGLHSTGLTSQNTGNTNNFQNNSTHFSQTATLIGLLLYYGADPNITDTQNNNCLHHISSIYRAGCSDTSQDTSRKQFISQQIQTCIQMVKLLIQYGCSKFATSLKGHIPLTIVCQAKKYTGEGATVDDILHPLIYGKQIHNLPTNTTTQTTDTMKLLPATCPLAQSPTTSFLTSSSCLLQENTSPPVQMNNSSASTRDDQEISDDQIASSLLKFRIDGTTCVHLAAHVGNSQILFYLLSKGADPNAKDKQGFTPLDIINNKLRKAGSSIAEKQAIELGESRKILSQFGASSRLRSDLPVEQDTETIKFIRNPGGGYSVKSATIEEIIHRLCLEPTYSEQDAKAISLCYHHVCNDLEFLSLIMNEFKILIHYDAKKSQRSSGVPEKSSMTTTTTVGIASSSSLSSSISTTRPFSSELTMTPGSSPGVLLDNKDVFDFSQCKGTTESNQQLPTPPPIPIPPLPLPQQQWERKEEDQFGVSGIHSTQHEEHSTIDLSMMKIIVKSPSKVSSNDNNNENTNSLSNSSDGHDSDEDNENESDDISLLGSDNLPLGGLFSFVMVWMNICQDKIDYSMEFLKLLREFAMLILRFCPEDISTPSLALFETAVAVEGKSDLLLSGFRNIAIDGNIETIHRHHQSTTQRNQIRESVDAYALDGILQYILAAAAAPSSAASPLSPKASKSNGIDTDKDKEKDKGVHLLTSIKPIVFVQQMTIMQHHLYKKIPISEMLSKKYTDAEKCPNLDIMKRWNTTVSNYLLNEILRCSTISSRAETIKFILISGFICLETMNNFDLVVLIQGVLERTPIYRLKQTWERVEKLMPNKRAEFKKLVGICGKNIGNIMNKSEPPMIPYLGTIMQWIMNNHEIPSILDISPSIQHLNISKHRHLAMIIHTFETGQRIPYTIDLDLNTQKIIFQTLQWFDEESLQNRSLELEPMMK